MRKSGSHGSLNGSSMKIRRNNSKSYSGRNFASFDSAISSGRGPGGGGNGWLLCSPWGRLRVLSFYLTVFISGCLLTGFLLSLSPQTQLERTPARVMLAQHPAGALHRRGLYTASTSGKQGCIVLMCGLGSAHDCRWSMLTECALRHAASQLIRAARALYDSAKR